MSGGGLKRFLLGLRGAALLGLDTPIRWMPKSGPGDRERVLIVRLDGIGDFLLWLDAARALRELYPAERYELTLLGHSSWAALARELGWFDEVWALDPRRFVWDLGYRLSRMASVRRAGFTAVVQARLSRELFVDDAVTRVSRAPARLAAAREWGRQTRWQKRLSDRWYTRLISVSSEAMELERNAQLLRGLGLEGFRAGVPRLPAPPPPPSLGTEPYFVLFPGASWPGKQWPVRNFAEVADRLHARTGWRGVVCGGPDEEALGDALLSLATAPLQNWAGRTSLAELPGVMRGARLVVSNDTSGIHMAAAVNTPGVCILGGGHYGRFLPYDVASPGRRLPLPVIHPMPCFGCDWHCVYPVGPGEPVPCVANVGVEAVWAAVEGVLAGGAGGGPARGVRVAGSVHG